MATIQNQIIKVLLSMPHYQHSNAGRSTKYEHVIHEAGGVTTHYWIGKAGALRKGDTVSRSVSMASGSDALALVKQWKATNMLMRSYSDALDALKLAGRDVMSTKIAGVQWKKRDDQAWWIEHALAIAILPWATFVTVDRAEYEAKRAEQAEATRASYAESERRKETMYVAMIMSSGAKGAGSWARGALVDAMGGSQDAVDALGIEGDHDGELLASVPDWCLAVNPWATWASQGECKNVDGEVVALVTLCGSTMPAHLR